jgi:hypothetical protein
VADTLTHPCGRILATPATLVYHDGKPILFSRSGWKEDVKIMGTASASDMQELLFYCRETTSTGKNNVAVDW